MISAKDARMLTELNRRSKVEDDIAAAVQRGSCYILVDVGADEYTKSVLGNFRWRGFAKELAEELNSEGYYVAPYGDFAISMMVSW